MARKYLWPLLAIGLFFVFFGGRSVAQEAPPKEILIGDVVSYTGPYSIFGGLSSFGTQAAIEDINRTGGVYLKKYGKRIPVRWVTRDCQSDPLKVVPLTEELVLKEKVHIIGGHFEIPTLRQGTAMVAEKYKVPAVFGVGTYEAWMGMRKAAPVPWRHSWAFGFSIGTPAPPGDFRENDPGYLMMPTWMGALKEYAEKTNKKIAVFALDDPDGRGWYKGFTGAAEQMGFKCYGADREFGIYPVGTTDFTSLIQEWKKAGCEILWGNAPAPDIGTLLRQCKALKYHPKIVFATRGAMFQQEIAGWGGDLPNGVLMEIYWTPDIKDSKGIGNTTPASLAKRWYEKNKSPLPQGIGWNYAVAQTIFDVLERAGSLDPEDILKALAQTDYVSIWGRVVFEKEGQFQRVPLAIGQWQKVDKPWKWECPVVFSYNKYLPVTGKLVFPKPW